MPLVKTNIILNDLTRQYEMKKKMDTLTTNDVCRKMLELVLEKGTMYGIRSSNFPERFPNIVMRNSLALSPSKKKIKKNVLFH